VAVIADLKRRSPSAGLIAPKLDPAARATAYAAAGASALSVLTEGEHFGGSIADLEAVGKAVSLPLIRKDFILHELQVTEARAAGAAAILLIVRALEPAALRKLLAAARGWGLEALVEAHDQRDIDLALGAGATIIGVNSRDLGDFSIDATAAWELVRKLPGDVIAVAESGMKDVAAVVAAADAGADAAGEPTKPKRAVIQIRGLDADADPGFREQPLKEGRLPEAAGATKALPRDASGISRTRRYGLSSVKTL